jgi:transcriptional regulator with GAF, ATPase, and Fis domain
MTHSRSNDTQQWLVPVAPELLVSVLPDQEPRIKAITPQLVSWLDQDATTLVGRPLTEVFDAILPALATVVEEVCTSKHPVRDYRVKFTDAHGIDRTVLLQANLRAAEQEPRNTLVALTLTEQPPRKVTERSKRPRDFHGLVGHSQALRAVIRKIEIYGPTDAPVIITGETGTGKELTARALHVHSKRQRHPFVAVNCAALSEELLESELFGHERGAFTSAVRAHRGRFERAHNGTLFLDEIGEMPVRLQAKLLRVLEEGAIERVGGEREVPVDVRVLTATNVSLEQAVQTRAFRLDLYHRLDVLRIHMPPLRERLDDIPLLVAHFLAQLNRQYGRHIHRLTPDAIALLQSYAWPGNFRELRNVLERVYVETTAEVIGRKAFDEWVEERARFHPGTWNLHARQVSRDARPLLIPPYSGAPPTVPPLLSPAADTRPVIDIVPRRLETYPAPAYHNQAPIDVTPAAFPPRGIGHEITQEAIAQAYEQANGNITQAARLLGVHKATLYRHMKTLGLTRDALEAGRKRS